MRPTDAVILRALLYLLWRLPPGENHKRAIEGYQAIMASIRAELDAHEQDMEELRKQNSGPEELAEKEDQKTLDL